MKEENYNVKTETFQGPLELLLHLIENRKMHISEVSLSNITDDYINYLDNLKKISLKSSADFILTASILMLIKSKSLLPELDLTREEESSIEELEDRLKKYQEIKKLSLNIEKIFGKKIIFARQFNKKRKVVFSPNENIKKEKLLFLMTRLIQKIPKKNHSPKTTVDKVISLEEVINNLKDRIDISLKMSFKKYSGIGLEKKYSKEKKINIVINFLAMLELVKQGAIKVTQNNQFGDIDMNTQKLDIPNYK